MGNPVHIALLAMIVSWIGPAVLAGKLAERKGRSFAAYLVVSLVIGWPIPLVAALIVPRRRGLPA